MKYVPRSIGQGSADPIGACERQFENIDAGKQAPPIRIRSPNGGLGGKQTWTWEREERAENQLVERRTD
ncbi:MAG: hypothetical protein ACRECP_11670 [Methylocella sp.]